LIGFGFVVPGVFLLMILLPVAGLRRARSPDAVIRAVLLALPVAALIYALAGVYNAPWSDPGVSAAFWALAVAAYAGASEEPHDEEAFPSAQRNGYVFPRGTEGERV
jgi:4-amino-4-deoxy-L-arabinose transferase-like glycosyltransferase